MRWRSAVSSQSCRSSPSSRILPRVGCVEPRQQFDQGGFSGAILPHQRQTLAGANVQIDTRQCRRGRARIDELDILEADAVAGIRTAASSPCRRRGPTGCSRYSNRFDKYRLSSYRPLTADNAALTAACPCRNSIRYMVIWPTVIAPSTVSTAIQT